MKNHTEVECCDIVATHEETIQKVKSRMPADKTMKELADFYKVFGDGTRVRILCVLLQAEVCVCDLAELLEMTQSAISHQLRILKQMKLVKNRREGKTVYYSLADGHIQTIINQGMEHIAE
ncbi:MAG: helix-turn-helix transcriptional regulator [Dorea sp.]|jgi:DNA-binding transcriptional ArsR family regulator|nr:helix-turn-helix transcriptional regulator [Dorea sp.]